MSALPKTTLQGILRGPDGAALGGARLRFQLSHTGADLGSSSLLATTPVEVISAADGAVSAELWPNANGFSNSHYVVTAFVSDGSSEVAYEFGKIQVPNVGPADIADLLGAGVLRKQSVEAQVIEGALRAEGAAQRAEDIAASYNEAAVEARILTSVTGAIADLTQKLPLGPNLIKNSLMEDVDATGPRPVPIGYTAAGLTLEAVHPHTQGFEGVYADAAPPEAVLDPDLATAANPMWYGVYDIGPQFGNGGLRSGWGALGRGNILKITAAAGSGHRFLHFPAARAARTSRFFARAWVKIVQGSRLGFDSHSGYNGRGATGVIVTAADCANAPAGWVFVDDMRSGANLAMSSDNLKFALGFEPGEDIEAYLAMPYAWVPANESNHWFME